MKWSQYHFEYMRKQERQNYEQSKQQSQVIMKQDIVAKETGNGQELREDVANKRVEMVKRARDQSSVEKANLESRRTRDTRYNRFKEEFGDVFEDLYDRRNKQSGDRGE